MTDEGHEDLINAGGKVDPAQLQALYESNTDEDQPVVASFTLTRDLAKRLDRYLVDRIPWLSRTALQGLIQEEAVTVNGRVPKSSTRLRIGDVVRVMLPPPPSTDLPREKIPLEILHEDHELVVINKHDDIIVHPARGNQSGTIINGLAWHFENNSSGELSPVGSENARPGVVHRLDRHTTGVMVVAKTETAHWRLGRQFEQRRTRKRYLAVVHGRVEPWADVIDLPIGVHPTVRKRYAVRHDASGKDSVTLYRVREVYEDYTLVEVELRTGRTHQIRVHLSHMGWPIVGDDYYGGRHLVGRDLVQAGTAYSVEPSDPVITRQALHASLLGFEHPGSSEEMTCIAPLHADMRQLVRLLREQQFVEAPNVSGAVLDLDVMLPRDD
ncbi:MAG: RluA family pseudouridine synthase [Phycisphaerales bacterium]|nr:RluA family pseudouridine synthase [Phycisphaerales bacterium]